MLQALLQKIAGHEASDRQAAEDRYVQLLEAGEHDDAAVAELRSVMATLGKSAADAAADVQVLTRARQLQRTITRGSGLAGQLQAALKERDDYAVESQRIIEERRIRGCELTEAANKISATRIAAQNAQPMLKDLATKNAALLRTFELPEWA